MIKWITNEEYNLIKQQFDDDISDVDDVKIRTIKVLLTNEDKNINKANIIPGRYAIGQIIDDPMETYEKGTKVFFKPEKYCNSCYNCINKDFSNCINPQLSSYDYEGFLKDFNVVKNSDFIVIPEFKKDYYALFIDYISQALYLFDELDVKKGDHICVIGDGIKANIICQLAMYYQYVPILITENDCDIQLAQKLGVYYTYNSADNLSTPISSITGNRMCKKIIYLTNSSIPINTIDNIIAYKAMIAIVGMTSNNQLSISCLQQKQANLLFVKSSGFKFEKAINLIMQDIVKFDEFNLQLFKFDQINKYYNSKDTNECIIDMLML